MSKKETIKFVGSAYRTIASAIPTALRCQYRALARKQRIRLAFDCKPYLLLLLRY